MPNYDLHRLEGNELVKGSSFQPKNNKNEKEEMGQSRKTTILSREKSKNRAFLL